MSKLDNLRKQVDKLRKDLKLADDFFRPEDDPNGLGPISAQRHLDKNTIERLYWHYGRLVALEDILNNFELTEKATKKGTNNG